jgi:hypothetical protein
MFSLLASLLTSCVVANDPASSWLAYSAYTDPQDRPITSLSTWWIVPSLPAQSFGSNAPGWWFGVQTAKGDGALIQPILAYGYTGSHFSIFNGVFDWTDQSWHTSPEVFTVQPGDNITSSVTFNPDANSYTMYIASAQLGKSISTDYTILRQQTGVESQAFFVLEHQPSFCKAYPANGECTFNDIVLEVNNAPVTPTWSAQTFKPACNSQVKVLDPATIQFTWDPTAKDSMSEDVQDLDSAPAKLAQAKEQLAAHFEKKKMRAGRRIVN